MSVARLARAGVVCALLAALGGWTLERLRFGADDAAALARVEAELRDRFASSAAALDAAAAKVAPARDTILAASRDAAAARRLFELVAAALPPGASDRTGVTVYDRNGAPLAWAGHVWELPPGRTDGPSALLVEPGALGPRLVRLVPVVEVGRASPRLATIAVEQSLGRDLSPGLADTFRVATAVAPVALRVIADGETPAPGPFRFLIRTQDGAPLVEAELSPVDLAAARANWRRATATAVWLVLAIVLLFCTAPVVDWRGPAPTPRRAAASAAILGALVVGSRLVLWFGLPLQGGRLAGDPVDLILTNLMWVGLVWIAIDLLERRRYLRPRPPILRTRAGDTARLAGVYLLAGFASLQLLKAYERELQRIVLASPVDLLHLSLHPIDVGRLGTTFGLVLLHAAAVWAAAALLRAPSALWRARRSFSLAVGLPAGAGGAALGLLLGPAGAPPALPLLVAAGAAGACAAALASRRGRSRRTSQAARLGLLFLALLVPALATYPSLVAYATAAKETLVATSFGPQVASLRTDLQNRMREALTAIDALPSPAAYVSAGAAEAAPPGADRAFEIWARTALAEYRLTSAVELYNASGALVSRFALNLPEYGTGRHVAARCGDWDLFEEVTPFGSTERRALRASRGICDARRRLLGSIVVHVMLDYTALPFISSQSPYLESLRPDRAAAREGASGSDVTFVVFGWSRAPLFVQGTSAWALTDEVFDRLVASREPFWDTLQRDGQRFRVYFLSDRGGIYALGYPIITTPGHLIDLAELIAVTFVLFALILGGATAFNTLTPHAPASGRALLREVRRSFYSKLFLAFLVGAIAPVVALAMATRAYFVSQLNAGIEEAAGRTARVAQRLVEDYATLQQRSVGANGAAALQVIDDQIMLLVRIAIDQDVNLFDRTHLLATSERELFASGLLSPRTPADVYRRIVLDRLPTYVGVEQVGDLPYLLAAAPVRAGGSEGIVTVPVALRQHEIEQQKDELDRRVLFAAVLFILLGGVLGYWMAERIADPVNRLTRATRRIARGELDARIAATSSDELRRLVEDFNQMAADLQRQRTELERTQRLEAWAEMARQVAHEIKNPLTPIQLSAEHARRVNLDRGRPLSPVLDECVSAILSQVRLLRQIAAEFSSFASSPTAKPEPTDLSALLDEVLEPYRAGLAGRVELLVQAPAGLPPATIDRTLFSRALTNVVENALHAMPGGGRLTVTARCGADPTAIVVEVADTGIGMDPESVARVFEPYFSTKAAGTGLGLTIARRNLELNGGRIEVMSHRGVGTTVTLTLPVNAADGQ
ncbi:MAG: HAMP domain-containing protein [Acidobacteria bacterium]|nr:HAMP domain-containing protein [Acidobacteriota bacterium]